MRFWLFLLGIGVYVATNVAAAAEDLYRVRAVDAWAAETLDRAQSRSAIVRSLLRELEGSDVIVHVRTASRLPHALAGMTRFVSRTGGYRYLRIDLDRALLPDARAAILGHELQHACEIARSGAASQDEVRRLFLTIGTLANDSQTYETREAMSTTLRVWRELRTRTGVPLESEPIRIERPGTKDN